jgi:hypothetical protein
MIFLTLKMKSSGVWHQWEMEDLRKGCRKVNMEEILKVMHENGKTRLVETISGMGEEG